jgi:hypothetical protein
MNGETERGVKMSNGNHLDRHLLGHIELSAAATQVALASLANGMAVSADQRRYLGAASRQLEALLRSLEDLKTWRVAEGPARIELGEVDLVQALVRAVSLLEGEAREKSTRLEVVERAPCSILCDTELVLKALLYLLRAELEAAAQGCTISVRAYREGENACVEVTNPSRSSWQRVLPQGGPGRHLFLAQRLAHALGGALRARKGRQRGTLLFLPCDYRSPHLGACRFQSRVNSGVQLVVKQAAGIRRELEASGRLGRRLEKRLAALEDVIGEVRGCANSLALFADEMAYREQAQEDRVAQLEMDQLTFFDCVLDIARELVSFHKGLALNPERARRVARLALSIASELRLSGERKRSLYYGALLHDLVLPPAEAEGRSSQGERVRERLRLLRAISQVSFLSRFLPLSLAIDERFDGSGSPHGLKGRRIPLEARILAVADRYEALVSKASSLRPASPDRAKEEIVGGSGMAFDPAIVDAFLRAWKGQRLAMDIEGVDGSR